MSSVYWLTFKFTGSAISLIGCWNDSINFSVLEYLLRFVFFTGFTSVLRFTHYKHIFLYVLSAVLTGGHYCRSQDHSETHEEGLLTDGVSLGGGERLLPLTTVMAAEASGGWSQFPSNSVPCHQVHIPSADLASILTLEFSRKNKQLPRNYGDITTKCNTWNLLGYCFLLKKIKGFNMGYCYTWVMGANCTILAVFLHIWTSYLKKLRRKAIWLKIYSEFSAIL